MKKLLFLPLILVLSTNAHALSAKNWLGEIASLVENGQIFKLRESAKQLGLNDIDNLAMKPVANGDSIRYTYHNNDKDIPIASISHIISVGGLGDYELNKANKSVIIHFKEHCPSIKMLKLEFGEQFKTVEMVGSPSLQTGRGIAYQSHYIYTPNNIISVENNGCEWHISGTAEFK
ncbi:hypothetical protein [Moraxella sp. ZY210820]|uniref:hypothetical protein n=1 Tax=unclassified Moraxella TaxID=2685852 RepID=UPI0027309BA6|nr:hypothetical protein [Moraxella sp. ZY210820]WLF84961.1 hypothetical protein LU301_05720 [Moraxella sp. ZY210820]